MPIDDEWTKLLPKVHDLWSSYWMYPTLQPQLLEDLTIEWLGTRHLHHLQPDYMNLTVLN